MPSTQKSSPLFDLEEKNKHAHWKKRCIYDINQPYPPFLANDNNKDKLDQFKENQALHLLEDLKIYTKISLVGTSTRWTTPLESCIRKPSVLLCINNNHLPKLIIKHESREIFTNISHNWKKRKMPNIHGLTSNITRY